MIKKLLYLSMLLPSLGWGSVIINPSRLAIGGSVSGGNPNSILYLDSSGNLAQSINLLWDGTALLTSSATISGWLAARQLLVSGAVFPGYVARFVNTDPDGSGVLIEDEGTDGHVLAIGSRLSIFHYFNANGDAVLSLGGGTTGIGTQARNLFGVGGSAAIGSVYSNTYDAPANGLLVEGGAAFGTTDNLFAQVYINQSAGMDYALWSHGVNVLDGQTTIQSLTGILMGASGVVSAVSTLPVASGGTGATSFTNGQLLIGNTATGGLISTNTITGTTNRITVTNGGGTITLTTPQDTNTAASVQFLQEGLGTAGSTSQRLKFAAATTSQGPINFSSIGSLKTTPAAGDLEVNSDDIYYTIQTGAARKNFVLADAALTINRFPYTTTNGRVTTSANAAFDATTATFTNLSATNASFANATSFNVTMPSTETVTAGGTITANGCSGIKRITSATAVTSSTSNTFTAPAAANAGCEMWILNVGTNTITLDNNTNFVSSGGTDVVVTSSDSVKVGSTGDRWWQLTAVEAN